MSSRDHAQTSGFALEDYGRDAWLTEPDEKAWVDPTTGFACLALRGPHGGWCGYVAVPLEHPAHGLNYYTSSYDIEDYEALTPAKVAIQRQVNEITAHGGLTYAGGRRPMPNDGPDASWWFGFDCAHAGDFSPKFDRPETLGRATGWGGSNTYRTLPYVEEQITGLAAQLAGIAGSAEGVAASVDGQVPGRTK